MAYKLLIAMLVNLACADWVEIPQMKQSKRIDFTTFILTTTSSTTQTPIFAKPATPSRKLLNETANIVLQANKAINKFSNNQLENESSQEIQETQKSIVEKIRKGNVDPNANDGDSDEENEDIEENHENNNQYSYSYFIPYLSTIQKSLMQNVHRSKKSKLDVLLNLRDHLLGEIKDRITSLWSPEPKQRTAREYKEESHVDFPSNEGALVTIGFLTFAVFLIKLVLQLIQNMGNNNGTTTAMFIGRKRRSTEYEEDAIKVLNYLDQYRFK